MNLIDELQRFGMAYHFETQIEEALRRMYNSYTNGVYNDDDDLNVVSIRFRLLRQQGYNVSSVVFLKFMDDEGNFNVILASNTLGMLNLYEAAHLSTQGEVILDDALAFTRKHLKSMIPLLSPTLARHVEKSLDLPLHKCIPRLNARLYIPVYQEQSTKSEVLLELAKLDFNLLQSIHQRELRDFSRWWKDIDVQTKLPYARERILELWGVGAMDQLPDYIKAFFQAIVNTISEIEEELTPDEKYRISYLKESVKCLNRAYFDEAKWLHSGHRPTFEEYINIALITTGYPFLILVSYIGMDEIVKKEAFDLINSYPNIIKSTCILGRVLNDIQSLKFEKERVHIPSIVECYVKSHRCTELEAHEKLQEMVSIAWKDVNQEFINLNHIPMPLIIRVLNFARANEVMYRYRDGYTDSLHETKDNITLLLVDPIPLGKWRLCFDGSFYSSTRG
ncbi:beta-cubebene synthase-like [Tasmannia lanceolata]|uniref:beta-cubebene synthase-like n=1 Tax=Tasmannia lanceolata TaxID=3420 RepID=UPI004062FB43